MMHKSCFLQKKYSVKLLMNHCPLDLWKFVFPAQRTQAQHQPHLGCSVFRFSVLGAHQILTRGLLRHLHGNCKPCSKTSYAVTTSVCRSQCQPIHRHTMADTGQLMTVMRMRGAVSMIVTHKLCLLTSSRNILHRRCSLPLAAVPLHCHGASDGSWGG